MTEEQIRAIVREEVAKALHRAEIQGPIGRHVVVTTRVEDALMVDERVAMRRGVRQSPPTVEREIWWCDQIAEGFQVSGTALVDGRDAALRVVITPWLARQPGLLRSHLAALGGSFQRLKA